MTKEKDVVVRVKSLLGVGLIAIGASLAAFGAQERESTVTQLIVRYKNESQKSFVENGPSKAAALSTKIGVALKYRRAMSGNAYVLSLPASLSHAEAIALARRIALDPTVDYAEPDEVVQPALSPNDPLYPGNQWHLFAPSPANGNAGGVNGPAAWDVSRGQGVVVAVLDTGIVDHTDLSPQIIGGYDFITDPTRANDGDGRDADPRDPGDWRSATDCPSPANTQRDSTWHGTHVAGTIAELTNNFTGMAGLAYESRVLSIRVLGRCGGLLSDIADGMRWAAGLSVIGTPANLNPAKVLNMSLGASSPTCSATYQSAIADVRAAGSAIVVATGNDGAATISSPANCPGVIAVTAHTYQGDRASFANYGAGTAISAPGGGACATPDSASFTCSTALATASTNGKFWVWSTGLYGVTTPTSQNRAGTMSGETYAANFGTSMATPHVSAVAALLYSQMPSLQPDEIRSLIVSSARAHPTGLVCDTGTVGACGSGLLDARAALDRLSDRTPALFITPVSAVASGGQQVVLSAQATPRNGGSSVFSYAWSQVSGTPIALSNANTASPSFIAPNPGGLHALKVTVRDVPGYSVSDTIVVRSNNPPILAPVGTQSVVQGSAITFNVTATDPENDTLTFVAANIPVGATFSAATGQFNWPSASAALGSYDFTVFATDGIANSVTTTVTVNIVNAPAVAVREASSGTLSSVGFMVITLLHAVMLWRRVRRKLRRPER